MAIIAPMQEAFRRAMEEQSLSPQSKRLLDSTRISIDDGQVDTTKLKYDAERIGRHYSSWFTSFEPKEKALEPISIRWQEVAEASLRIEEPARADVIAMLTRGMGIGMGPGGQVSELDRKKRNGIFRVITTDAPKLQAISAIPNSSLYTPNTYVIYGFTRLSEYSDMDTFQLCYFIDYVYTNLPPEIEYLSVPLVLSSWMKYKQDNVSSDSTEE